MEEVDAYTTLAPRDEGTSEEGAGAKQVEKPAETVVACKPIVADVENIEVEGERTERNEAPSKRKPLELEPEGPLEGERQQLAESPDAPSADA